MTNYENMISIFNGSIPLIMFLGVKVIYNHKGMNKYKKKDCQFKQSKSK